MQKDKPLDSVEIPPGVTFVWAAVETEILGPAGSLTAAYLYQSNQTDVVLQNRSVDWIDVTTVSGSADGLRIPAGGAISMHVGQENENSIYIIGVGAGIGLGGNVSIGIAYGIMSGR